MIYQKELNFYYPREVYIDTESYIKRLRALTPKALFLTWQVFFLSKEKRLHIHYISFSISVCACASLYSPKQASTAMAKFTHTSPNFFIPPSSVVALYITCASFLKFPQGKRKRSRGISGNRTKLCP